MKDKKFCFKCGKEVESDAEFCPYCGAKQTIEESTSVNTNGTTTTEKKSPKKRWYKRWWIWIIAVVVILLILSSIGNFFSPDPKDVASDIKTTLQQDNAVDVVSVKADKSTGTIKVKVKETKAIEQLYEGYPAGFKALQRDLVNSSKKYANKKNDDFDLSYIQLMKPGTSHKILLAVDKGKIKYTALDN